MRNPADPRRLAEMAHVRRQAPLILALAAVAAATGGAWWGLATARNSPALPRNVLLITVDTLRADALGAYGNGAAATPWIDRLAAGGVRFTAARAHTVVTLPSHANILTGRLPPDHGVRDNAGFRVPVGVETLATRLKARGFHTAAFISAFPLDSRFGLARGFDIYDDAFVDATPRPALLEQERAGSATVAAAVRWLQGRKDAGPWFCWVHLYEPHYPYAPPEPFASKFPRDAYAGEVAATDHALGPLLQPILDARSSLDTLVIFTSDHGESLGDHGEATHGIFAYEATLKVPLVLYYPPRLEPQVRETAVEHVDIVPTIMEALGLPPVPDLRGRSLIDPTRDRSETNHITYFEALSGSLNRGWAPLAGTVKNGVKFIDLPIPELYDLHSDPAEARNLAESRPQEVAERRELQRTFGSRDLLRIDETAVVKERLGALGYVSSSGRRSAGTLRHYTDADDPKRLIGIEQILQEVVGLHLSGNTRDALERSRALVAQHPDMRVALLQLAQLEREAGNLPSAVAALRHALEVNPGDTETASLLAASLTAAGRPGDATEVLRPYAAPPDADVQVLVALALAEARAGRFPDAIRVLDRARAQDPSNATLLVAAGTVEMMAGRRSQARAAFDTAVALNADVARAHSSLAALAADEGRLDEALAHWRRAVALDAGEYEKLLAVGISLARSGRAREARPYLQLFADAAPSPRYAADIAKARDWLSREQR